MKEQVKVYVQVDVRFDEEGQMHPLRILWEDGNVFTIDRVVKTCRAASLRAGGAGLRYTCRIHGKETYLYFEETRWFVERRHPGNL